MLLSLMEYLWLEEVNYSNLAITSRSFGRCIWRKGEDSYGENQNHVRLEMYVGGIKERGGVHYGFQICQDLAKTITDTVSGIFWCRHSSFVEVFEFKGDEEFYFWLYAR